MYQKKFFLRQIDAGEDNNVKPSRKNQALITPRSFIEITPMKDFWFKSSVIEISKY